MTASITYQSVTRRFGSVTALRETDLQIDAGQFVALVGPSGCGKTTLLRMTADLDSPSSGQIRIGDMTPSEARRKRMLGLVSQRPAVLPWKRAVDDVRFTQTCAGSAGLEANALLRDFGLSEHMDKLPHHLSGGMLQRVNFASAIAHDPAILLMDEPFSALDEMKREELGLWLGKVLVERTKTVLFVTHHVDEAVLLSDRVLVFAGTPGRVVADLPVRTPRPRGAEFRTHPEFVELTNEVRRLLFGREEAAK
ncbi:MAG: ABC transporter ATP-binding protein [Ramlibacter sp.]|nr:ABC transporter ATP-binding protein [Ramlibacter sp.]